MGSQRVRSRSSNPFMVTSNECYGMSIEKVARHASSFASPIVKNDGPFDPNSGEKQLSQNESLPSSPDMTFLYSRESDQHGKGVNHSDSALSKILREKETDPISKRRKYSIFVKESLCRDDANTGLSRKTAVTKEEVAEIISNYDHKPKEEHPLFSTTANEFGSRKPTGASLTTARYGLSQKFSQSFNRTMYRDEGLNASVTKNRIHDHLNIQFV
mmetsp:Transcript_15972/g.33517  ORF Transcript_15972/g.33517 Transcript_15972/m.33517 type:complete len:215 (-) Transcript_15972:48-692(-)